MHRHRRSGCQLPTCTAPAGCSGEPADHHKQWRHCTCRLLSAPSLFHECIITAARLAGRPAIIPEAVHHHLLACVPARSWGQPVDSIHSPVTAKGATRNSPPGQWSCSVCRPRPGQAPRAFSSLEDRTSQSSPISLRRFAEIQASVQTWSTAGAV